MFIAKGRLFCEFFYYGNLKLLDPFLNDSFLAGTVCLFLGSLNEKHFSTNDNNDDGGGDFVA